MNYRVEFAHRARCDIENCIDYFTNFSEDFAVTQIERLYDVIANSIAQTPTTWNHFFLTGAPYRAYLFRVGRRTQFWIVYTVDEQTKVVNVLRFWNASRDTENFRI